MSAAETIAVTGADGQVGRALLRSVAQGPARVIALTRAPADIPAARTIVGPLDSPVAVTALKEADWVVHLAGTLRPRRGNSYRAANVETSEAVARTVREGKTRRVVFLSYVGASEGARNPYLQTKAIAERVLAASGKEIVIFRCTHIIGPPEAPGPTARAMLAGPGGRVTVLGSGRQVVAPVFLGDVVTAVQAAMGGGFPGIYELPGPERMALDDLVRLLNRDPDVAMMHVPPWAARLLGPFLPRLPAALVDVMLRDSVGDGCRATAAFGVPRTSLREIWT